MEIEFIGHVGVDSGQLLLCDPCYIDSQWEKEDFNPTRTHKNKITGETLTWMRDFANYQEVIAKHGKCMNELNDTGEWEEIKDEIKTVHQFSYNACAKATLSNAGFGQLNFKLGHPGVGVAFRTAHGDGYFPVYANYADDGRLLSIEVIFDVEDDDN
jgi:hypothetical protein